MKPAAFDYLKPHHMDEVLEALAAHGDDARVLAGGQSLMPMLNMRLVQPQVLIDLACMPGYDQISCADGIIEIGCRVRQAQLDEWPQLPTAAPLLKSMLRHVGHVQTRNRGTVCGSLCHADPSSELPLAIAILGGELVLQSRAGERRLDASDFQIGMLTTAKQPDEVMVAARFPEARADCGYAFTEFARRHGDFAIVAIACVANRQGIRLGVGGVADKPTVIEWPPLTQEADLDDALNAFAWELGGYDDIHATARHRRELVRRLGKTVIKEASACLS